MKRKLLILTGCLFLLGIGAYAQAPIANFSSNVTAGCGPLTVEFKDLSTNNPTSWEWDFGNGQTSPLQNPQASYSTPGTYTVTLIVKNASGADAIRMVNYITVYPYPHPAFGANLQLACAPANVQFTDFSTPGQGSITSYAWNFGDGSPIDPNVAPAHTYTQTGYYNVNLTVTNSGGCSNTASATRFIRVVPGIQPAFTWDQTSTSCTPPYLLNFTNQTAGPGTLSYNWTLGTNAAPATSTAVNPTNISYPAPGDYSVTMAVQSSFGCTGTLTQTVPLSAGTPVINAPAAGCLNTPVSFSNGSTPAPLSSTWDFGDGSPLSNLPNPTHTYTVAGPYTVTLTNNFATCSSPTTQQITIGATLVPVFMATPVTGCQTPLTVQFQDQTPPTITQWLWNFGDGSPNATSPNPSHTYTATGSYNVTLTVTNASGCTGTVTQNQEVTITAPSITMPPASGCVGDPVLPQAKVTAVDGVASYAWSAPGATPSSSTSATPSFVYSTSGLYSLTLTITTNGGCTATQVFTNIVQVGTPTPVTPANIASSSNPICGNDPVSFSTTVTPVDATNWTLGDGTSDSGSTITHTYKNSGNFKVTLIVDHFGCETTTSITEVVSPAIPNFGYQTSCPPADNHVVTFNDSTLPAPAPPGLTYKWDFGDASPAFTSTTPPYLPAPHTYPGYASYPVTLTVTDGVCVTTTSKPVLVDNIIPSFTFTPSPVCENSPLLLSSTSQTFPNGTPAAGYIWTVGTLQIPQSHTFSTTIPALGVHPLALTVKDENGCLYTSAPGPSVTVIGPTAAFTAPTGGCVDGAISFTDNSTSDPPGTRFISWGWTFGDGKDTSYITAAPVITHQFADTGSYLVTFVVEDADRCVSSFLATVPVKITDPVPNFSSPDSFYCPAAPITFIDSSQGSGLTETWNFGDGPGTFTSPTHTYPATNGIYYNVTLTVKDQNGCIQDTTKRIKIQSPIAAFTITDTTAICFPLETMFTAQGQYYDSLYWDFGDGTTSTLPVTSHFYNTADTFYASLVLQGPGGCLDSATRRVLLLDPNKTTTFLFNPKTACDSVVAQFTIVPPGYTTFSLAFGDGKVDSSQNTAPVHTFRSPESYSPLLTLTDATGCIVNIFDTTLTVLGAVPFFTVDKTKFCDSATVYFTDYTITNDGILSKAYMFGDGNTLGELPPLTNAFDTTHFYNTPGLMQATLNVVTDHNCTASYIDTIMVYQTPSPAIGTTGYLCAGLIQFQGTLATPDADTVNWAWNFGNGQTANVQNPLVTIQAGSYPVSLRAYVTFGCADTVSETITINPNPVIKGPTGITTPVGVPVTIPFTYSSDVTTYSWTPTSNLDCATCANPSATLIFNQEYTVLVTDSNNCTDTASILIKTICNEGNYFLPNTFSPNGDGVNDYFYPRGTGLYNIQSMRVFNRWGQLVFQRQNFAANSETMGWDGTFNGHPAPSDAYVYIVEVICNNAQVVALHGNVTLLR